MKEQTNIKVEIAKKSNDLGNIINQEIIKPPN